MIVLWICLLLYRRQRPLSMLGSVRKKNYSSAGSHSTSPRTKKRTLALHDQFASFVIQLAIDYHGAAASMNYRGLGGNFFAAGDVSE